MKSRNPPSLCFLPSHYTSASRNFPRDEITLATEKHRGTCDSICGTCFASFVRSFARSEVTSLVAGTSRWVQLKVAHALAGISQFRGLDTKDSAYCTRARFRLHSSLIPETRGRPLSLPLSLSGDFNFVSTSEECRVVPGPEEGRGGIKGRSLRRRFRYTCVTAPSSVDGDGDFKGRIRLYRRLD